MSSLCLTELLFERGRSWTNINQCRMESFENHFLNGRLKRGKPYLLVEETMTFMQKK